MTTFRVSPDHRPDPTNPDLIPYRDTWGPKRIQRKRTKGWRMPEGAVYVGRPSRWGNPFVIGGPKDRTPEEAVGLFREYVAIARAERGQAFVSEWLEELRGRDLACWCPLGQPCHADVLLDLSNR